MASEANRSIGKERAAVRAGSFAAATTHHQRPHCTSSSSSSANLLRKLLIICFAALAVFVVFVAYPMLRAEHRQAQPTVGPESTAAVDGETVHGGRSALASRSDRTILALAAVDPTETQVQRRIDMLLAGGPHEFRPKSRKYAGRTFAASAYRHQGAAGDGDDDYGDINRDRLTGRPNRRRSSRYESWLLQLQSPRYDASWPRFRQLLNSWSRNKTLHGHPAAMADHLAAVKAAVDDPGETNSDGAVVPQRYKTCAVVGNSGILLNESKHFGPFIDSHEAVIRLNNARIKGFADSVGNKTTFSFINSNVYHACSRRPFCFCYPYGDAVPIVLYVCQVQHLMDIAYCEPRHRGSLTNPDPNSSSLLRKKRTAPVFITDPRFDVLCARIVKWYSLQHYVESTGNDVGKWSSAHSPSDFHYSSGFQAVLLALGICDRVDILGFGKNPLAKHHYHTNQKSELALHDYEAEYLFYDDLAMGRVSTIPFLRDAGIHIPPVAVYR